MRLAAGIVCFGLLCGHAQAADLGSKKPQPWGPSPAFAKSDGRLLNAGLAAGVSSVFSALVFYEFLGSPGRTEPFVSFPWGSFAVVLHASLGRHSNHVQSYSNLSAFAVPNFNAIIIGPPTFASSQKLASTPATGLGLSYAYPIGPLRLGLALDWIYIGLSKERSTPVILLPTGVLVANGPDHRIATRMDHLTTGNIRLGWQLTNSILVYAQSGLAIAAAGAGVGLAEPAGALWKETSKARFGLAYGAGVEYQTASPWFLGAQMSQTAFRASKRFASEPSGRYVAGGNFHDRYSAAQIFVGYRW
jgi:hypothetical protein